MQNSRPRAAALGTHPKRRARLGLLLSAPLFAAALLLGAPKAFSEDAIIKSHAISTFGTPKYPADFAHLDYVNPEAPKGGEISISWVGTFDSMNPYTTKGRAGILSSVFFESLLTTTSDEIGTSYGLLAESLEYPESKDWVIFNIRPEAKFADGSDVTAEDVAFTYELFLNEGLPSFRAVLSQQVEGAEVLGPKRIKFTFKPEAPRRDVIESVGGLPVFSKAWFEETGAGLDESRLEPALGSGPYVLDSFDINRRIVYKRNPDYWGKDLPINIGRNNFDRIRIEYFGDGNAAFEGFKAGAYTFRNENSSKTWATQYDFPALEAGHVVKAELPDGTIATGQSFVMNLRRPQFQDPRVREAIGLMFNFEWSNKTLFYGIYKRINSFWDNTELAASGLPSAEELALLEPLADDLPPGVLTEEAVRAPVSGERRLDRRNLRKAAALLDEAGWTVGDDGLRRNAEGQTLKVEFLEDSPTWDRVINPYVESLRALGVDASLNRIDFAQYTDRTRNFDFDIITDQFPMGYEPGSGLKQYFGSETADTSIFNSMGLKSKAVDALIDHVIAAESQAELTIAVRALDRVLRAERFWVPQWFKDTHTVAYWDQYAYPEPLPPYGLGYLDFWWYDQEKADTLRAAGALK
ncbi:Oligopeptide-binding protein AppA precursor [Pseudoruegeria aquimaris]|uniref:Oligopeptide-binding protein AppA n=1 Tax=Pseudoruegeria aquimaris TaxID=393663 RepID=A0A1Y5SHD3_9RHOB|nr:extracellular solute-binding protein [Pseudoruegeria aquimaris]SLN39705.1 Oligopeptide-binding protein AppA precursor [Pseudoruegeria aquimaris]